MQAQYVINPRTNEQDQLKMTDDSGQIWIVPLDPANRHYAEIMRQVEAGELTIQPADGE